MKKKVRKNIFVRNFSEKKIHKILQKIFLNQIFQFFHLSKRGLDSTNLSYELTKKAQ